MQKQKWHAKPDPIYIKEHTDKVPEEDVFKRSRTIMRKSKIDFFVCAKPNQIDRSSKAASVAGGQKKKAELARFSTFHNTFKTNAFRGSDLKTPQVKHDQSPVVQFNDSIETHTVEVRKPASNLLKAKQAGSIGSRMGSTDEVSTATSNQLTRQTTVQKGSVTLETLQKTTSSFAQKKLTGIGLLMVNNKEM